MKRLFLILALLLIPTLASAQCTGVFPSGTVCGTLTQGPPHQVPWTSFIAPVPLTQNHFFIGNASGIATDTALSGDCVYVSPSILCTKTNGIAFAPSATTDTTNATNITTGTLPVAQLPNIPVTKLNSGTGASSSTYWRGDGTWAAVPSTGTGTKVIYALTNGVACDGVTDDSAAMSAIATSVAAGGYTVILPTGVCVLEGVTWPSNTWVIGQGGAGSCTTTIQRPANTAGALFTMGAAASSLADMCFDGNLANNGATALSAELNIYGTVTSRSYANNIGAFNGNDVSIVVYGSATIRGCLLLGSGVSGTGAFFGINNFNTTSDVDIIGCSIYGYQWNAIIGNGNTHIVGGYFWSNATNTAGGQLDLNGQFTVTGATIRNSPFSGIEVTGTGTISGNYIYQNSGWGVFVGTTIGAPVSSVVISDNVISGNSVAGIEVTGGMSGTVINSNHLYANIAAINLSGTTDYTSVVGNVCYTSGALTNTSSGTHNYIPTGGNPGC